MYPLVLVSTIEYYLQSHVMYLLPDDSVPAAAGEHLDPQPEAPVPHRAAPAAAGQDTAQPRAIAEERISFYGFLSGLARGHLQ